MFDIVNITGFQAFANIKINPTQLIIDQYRKNPHPKIRRIMKLDVTAKAVDTYVHYLSYSCNPREGRTLNLHLGVASDGPYQLEMCGYNNKDFRIPDNNGYQCSAEKIVTDMNLDQPLNTKVNLNQLANQLKGKGYQVEVSNDPGRFLCNYIYFSSLKKVSGDHCTSLFIHFPTHKYKSVQQNIKFVNDVIDLLTK